MRGMRMPRSSGKRDSGVSSRFWAIAALIRYVPSSDRAELWMIERLQREAPRLHQLAHALHRRDEHRLLQPFDRRAEPRFVRDAVGFDLLARRRRVRRE